MIDRDELTRLFNSIHTSAELALSVLNDPRNADEDELVKEAVFRGAAIDHRVGQIQAHLMPSLPDPPPPTPGIGRPETKGRRLHALGNRPAPGNFAISETGNKRGPKDAA